MTEQDERRWQESVAGCEKPAIVGLLCEKSVATVPSGGYR
jgi:hypothetical protein